MSDYRGRAGLCVLIVSVILPTAGCWDEGGLRQPVSGYVKLNGKPLANGVIIFYPVKGIGPDTVVSGGAMVNDGYFSIPRGVGLIPGQYFVAIRAAETRRKRSNQSDDDEPVARDAIPARFNSETELRIEIKDRAIKEVTFHLVSL